MEYAVIEQPNQVKIARMDPPTPGPGQVCIRVMASGICGTDLHIYRGEYMGHYPVIPGHEFSGVVEAVGPQVTRFQPGDRVAVEPNIACDNCANCLNNRQNFCLNWQAVGVTLPGGMAQFVLVPEKAAFNIGEMPFEHGAFMEPLSCVLHGIQRADIALADQVAILGAGPIGILMLQAARLQGAARITLVENNPGRAELARQLNADRVVENLDDLPRDAFDVVIDATGAIPLMQRSPDFARHGGTVLLFGVPPAGQRMELEAFPIFRKGLTILSSFTSRRNSFQAVNLLATRQIQVEPLISHQMPLRDFPKALELLERKLPEVRKVVIMPNA